MTALEQALRSALVPAMRAKDEAAVSALRSALSAVANGRPAGTGTSAWGCSKKRAVGVQRLSGVRAKKPAASNRCSTFSTAERDANPNTACNGL